MTEGFLPYRKQLTILARENRKNPTVAETKIWNEVLRMRRFANFEFLRQKPLAGYIVDFYCSQLQLVIEIDGESHARNIEYDIERTNVLKSLGLTVVRYSNNDVMTNLQGVYDNLSEAIAGIQPPSIPPCQGGGKSPSSSPANPSNYSSLPLDRGGDDGPSPVKGRRGRG